MHNNWTKIIVEVGRYKNIFRALQPSDGVVQVILISKADIWRFDEVSETQNGQNQEP